MASARPAPQPEDECSVCKDEFLGQETILLRCGHYFHGSCGQQWFRRQQPCRCPLCRGPFEVEHYYDDEGRVTEESDEWRSLRQEMRERAEASANLGLTTTTKKRKKERKKEEERKEEEKRKEEDLEKAEKGNC